MESTTSKDMCSSTALNDFRSLKRSYREPGGVQPAILKPAFSTAKRLRVALTAPTSMASTGPKEKPLDYSLSSTCSNQVWTLQPLPKTIRILPPGSNIAEHLRNFNSCSHPGKSGTTSKLPYSTDLQEQGRPRQHIPSIIYSHTRRQSGSMGTNQDDPSSSTTSTDTFPTRSSSSS